MLKRSFTKLGLGLALVAGCAFLEPAAASAQSMTAHIETVDHHDHDRAWGRDGHDRDGRWRGHDRDDWRWRNHDYYYPGYGTGFGFYFGNTPNYYYATPYQTPAPLYPATPGYPPAYSYPY